MDHAIPIASRSADALAAIMSIMGNIDHTQGHGENSARMRGGMLQSIREIVEQASAFDRDAMRLRIDDLHGNRSFIPHAGGRWQAINVMGDELSMSYPLGSPVDVKALSDALDAATTIHEATAIVMKAARRVVDVQVEAVWERHLPIEGVRLGHIPTPA